MIMTNEPRRVRGRDLRQRDREKAMRVDHSEYLVVAVFESGPPGATHADVGTVRCNRREAADEVAAFLESAGYPGVKARVFSDPPKTGQ